MSISFPFKEENSSFFGIIRRPVAEVFFKQINGPIWRKTTMLVDTGADYTLLPKFLAEELGVAFSNDCREIRAYGVGGANNVYFLKDRMKVKIGHYERKIPLGFINNDFIPPILGRHEFFETFKVVFEKFHTRFEL